MSTVEVRDESKHWRVIAIPAPNVGAELYKAMHVAECEYKTAYGHAAEWDSTFEVLTTDTEIIIRFEIKQGVQP